MAAQSSSKPFLKNLQRMLGGPKSPVGPPLPKKEILAVLRALRGQLDRLITVVENYGSKPAPRARKRARKTVAKSA